MSGITLGLYIGNRSEVLVVALFVVTFAFLLYNYIIHPWYLHNKNR